MSAASGGAEPSAALSPAARGRLRSLARRWPISLLALLALLASLAAAACAGPAATGAPPEIWFGEHECDRCRMIVGDERLAAAAVGGDETLRFDDLGCLLAKLEARSGTEWRVWVRDYAGGGWLQAEAGWFAATEDLVTPMGSGLAAFARPEGARSLAVERGGRVVRWDELVRGSVGER